MPENARLSPSIGQFDLDFVEREVTPRLLMKLSIQLYLAGLSILNTVRILETFGVKRARSTVLNWVYKADLQPDAGHSPDHVAVDETVIQLNDEHYWLYTAIDSETTKLPHTKLEPTRTKAITNSFFRELLEKHDVEDAVFLVDSDKSLNYVYQRHGLNFRYEKHRNRNSVERVFREVKRQPFRFQTFSVTHTERVIE